MDKLIMIFLFLLCLTKMYCQLNSQWTNIYNGVYEAKNIYCTNINCIYGFKNFLTNSPAKFVNCSSSPQTAIVLDNLQISVIQNTTTLSPQAPNAYKLLLFDVYFTSQWVDDAIEILYDNHLFQVRYTTLDPLQFSEGLCDSIQFEIKTFYLILPYTSNNSTYPVFYILNSINQALIRNVHVGYLSCYPKCLQCNGPNLIDCQAWDVIFSRCSIRQSRLSNGVCIEQCPIQNSIVKSQNRICVGFKHTQFFQSNLVNLDLSTLLNWNILYDPQHIDVSNKKVSPYNYGVFHFREGTYISLDINNGFYTFGVQVQLIYCNTTPAGSGVSFYINSTYYGSTYYDGTQFQYHNVNLRDFKSHPNTGSCTNNIFIELDMFLNILDKKFIFVIQGNFTQPNAGWFLRLFTLTSGFCPLNCILCNKRYMCQTCASGFYKVSDGTCSQSNCPVNSLLINSICTYYDQVTKYSKYLIKEFYDFTVKDTLNATFVLEQNSLMDLKKGLDIFWSYLPNKIIFGGKFVWAQSRFSQIYTLNPHHSLTIYFQIIFGPNFPNSPLNYFSYEINNGTENRVLYSVNPVQIIEQVLTYNPTLTIAIQCYGVNVIDSYCGLSNYYIVVHYCKPYCNQCSNELTCDVWMAYDSSIVKVEQSQCLSNQFLDDTTSTCENCPNECLTCLNEYDCQTCKPNYRLVTTTCILNCQLNQYYDGTNCLDCNYTCKQCQSSSYCIHCESTSLRYLENGQCLCFDGYYDQNNIEQCQPCDKLCSKCNGPTNKNCQACIVLVNLILNENTCECNNGYYFDEFQLQCLSCSMKCEKCFEQSDSSCLACHSTQFRILDGFDCKCQLGYYDNSQDSCIQCPAVEDALFTSCYKICGDGISIWHDNNCAVFVCPSGYDNINNQCLPICGDLQVVFEEQCDDGNLIQFDGCHNCRFQCPAQCTVCDATTVLPCIDICGDGIVSGLEECDDSNTIQFDGCYQCKIECQPQCTRCNKGYCSDCLTFGWVLDPYTKLCIESCGDKYYVGNEQCEDFNTLMLDGCYNCRLSCQQSCLTCTTIGCTSCKVGFKLINRYCRNICGDSMIVEGEDCDDGNQYPFDGCHQCVYQCQSECLECLNGICLFCIDGFEAFNGECVDVRQIPIIPFQEQYKQNIIEFCKITIQGICQECQQGYLLNDLQNICEFQKKNEILKIQIMDVLPQLIQYCQIQINNQCIICYKNFKLDIFTNKCEPICGDGIISGTEECEDNNYLVLDGCYQCKYQCSETCEICEFGKCILCQINTIIAPTTFQCEYLQQCTQPGSYYNQETNQCYSICGDGFVYLNEECDDGNDIEYDGCHKCYYSCQPGCKCIKGECYREQISCENGLYYSFTSLSCKPLCGDGITIQPFEECDDGNEISDDECNLCKLQCGVNCQTCSPQNYCLQCKEGYELFDYKCYQYNNSNCNIKNCEFCEINECLTCFIGYQLFDNMCFSQCGDGVLIDLEQCDDGNLINGDGCDDDCTQSENSICRDNECAILSSSFPILEFEREQQGIQFIRLKYTSKMQLIAGVTEQDYFDSLKFEIQNQTDLALIQIIAKTNITQELQFVDIQVSVEYIKYVQNPILLLRFVDKGILVNQDGAGISQDSISIRLSSSNVLRDQEQKVMTSLIGLNDYIIKIVAMTIAISSISGQGEIISNLLDTIQQLYYLKYINSRIGVNLQRFYETFKIIQLTNFFDFLGMNPNGSMKDIVSFYHSKPIFEMDDRNANYLNNFAQLFLVYAIFFLAYFCLKKVTFLILKKIHQLTCFQSNQMLLLIVNSIQKLCLRIQIISIIEPIQAIFLAMIYEFGLNTFLALRFQKSDFEGKLGVSIAISILYGVILLLIQRSSFSIPLVKKQQIQSQKSNSFTYLCMQKMLFISFLIFFFESSQIQILLCLLNEFQFIYFLYIRKILMLPSENIKQLASHFLQFIILGMYLVNDFYQDQPDVLIIIGWIIISLMSTILFMTLIIDLIKIVHPIWQKCKTSKTSEHHDLKQEIFCIVENPCNAQRKLTK